jgi:hypothetical protein
VTSQGEDLNVDARRVHRLNLLLGSHHSPLAHAPGVLDAELAALGGSVTRRAARDVYAELQGR